MVKEIIADSHEEYVQMLDNMSESKRKEVETLRVEMLKKHKEDLRAVDREKCKEFALNYSREEFYGVEGTIGRIGDEPFKNLKITPGACITLYNYMLDGVYEYLKTQVFQNEMAELKMKFGFYSDAVGEVCIIDLEDMLWNIADEIFTDKIFNGCRIERFEIHG